LTTGWGGGVLSVDAAVRERGVVTIPNAISARCMNAAIGANTEVARFV
jgi:hypothetical protein